MNEYQIRTEFIELGITEDGILIIHVVLGFIENRLNIIIQEEQLQDLLDITCSGTSQNGDPFFNISDPFPCQKLSSDRLFLAQDIVGIVWIFKLFHPKSSI